jgi:protein-S-isoprenylcysteine O-methyltransferase Ste14
MTAQSRSPGLRDGRLWDLAAAMPVIVICIMAAAGFAIQIHQQWPYRSRIDVGFLIASEASSAITLLFRAGLLCIRRLPVAKAAGLLPRIAAFVGANFSYLLLLLPKVHPGPVGAIISSVLNLLGTAGSIIVLIWLWKSFAIFPQARELVTGGPYRIVRHPLYLVEQVSAFGLMLQFQRPWGTLIILAGFFVQFPRMRYEENILRHTFPAYGAYEKNTRMIIPFLC